MSLRKFVDNPYADGIYQSFRGSFSDDDYYQLIESEVRKGLGVDHVEVLSLECGVGLSLLCKAGRDSLVRLKITKGTDALRHQTECCGIQRYLHRNGYPCTVPVRDPVPLSGCSLQFEENKAEGEYRDSHDPEVMAAQAEYLSLLHDLMSAYKPKNVSDIEKKTIPRDRVWQNPPQAVFSFDRHDSGDDFIREKAAAAKAVFEGRSDRKEILSHEDWSNKHFRFLDKKVSVIYDWDSMKWIDELYTIGLACSTFPATWYYKTKVFPTKEEAKAFVEAYSRISGKKYSSDEFRVISAYAAYTIAYIARCSFAMSDGTIKGNDIEGPFNEIENGVYF